MRVVICECCGDSNSQMESGRVQARREPNCKYAYVGDFTPTQPEVAILETSRFVFQIKDTSVCFDQKSTNPDNKQLILIHVLVIH